MNNCSNGKCSPPVLASYANFLSGVQQAMYPSIPQPPAMGAGLQIDPASGNLSLQFTIHALAFPTRAPASRLRSPARLALRTGYHAARPQMDRNSIGMVGVS